VQYATMIVLDEQPQNRNATTSSVWLKALRNLSERGLVRCTQ